MSPEHQALKLRNDRVLVVPGIADDGAAFEPRQIMRVRSAGTVQDIAEVEFLSVVDVRLVRGPAPVDIVHVERRRAEVHEPVRVERFGQRAHRIEGDVVIDELAEIGIERRDAALLAVLPILSGFVATVHGLGELVQTGEVGGVVSAELGRRKISEQSSESTFEQGRSCRLDAAGLRAMDRRHRVPPFR